MLRPVLVVQFFLCYSVVFMCFMWIIYSVYVHLFLFICCFFFLLSFSFSTQYLESVLDNYDFITVVPSSLAYQWDAIIHTQSITMTPIYFNNSNTYLSLFLFCKEEIKNKLQLHETDVHECTIVCVFTPHEETLQRHLSFWSLFFPLSGSKKNNK